MSAPRFPCTVDEAGRLVPVHPERVKRLLGREVWVSVHQRPAPMLRGDGANRYLWGVCYSAIAMETGNDPESVHYGLKRAAVEQGVLEPQYIVLGDKLIEDEPTTVVDSDTFWKYVNWVRHWAEHELSVHIPEPGE